MALIDLLEVSKTYEAQKILIGVNFAIDEGERVAIVGRNGSGKSTLMKIVANTLIPDDGKRIIQNGITVEMLDQNPKFDPTHTVRQAVENELTEYKNAKIAYDTLSLRLADEFDNKELLHEHGKLGAFLDHHNAWNLDDRIERVLREFSLKEFETTPVITLSGGEQRRVALAGLLLKKPDILLLDEPTNHLDVQMVEFLEELILKEKFTLLFISHDRYFIDQIATRTIEIEEGTIRSYRGGYALYLAQKEEMMRALSNQHDNLVKLLKKEEEWLRRGVKARLKRNEGRKQRVLDMREQAKKNPSVLRQMKLQIEREKKHFMQDASVNRQKMLFELESIDKTLGDKQLITNFSTRILQKDRIAIVGRNGSGKSTLLKILLGRMAADAGKVKQGEITIGYFDQHRELLDDNKNLMETFCPNGGDRVIFQGHNLHVYGYLKNFLFPKEYLDKKIGVLSGGEKNRVALALLFTKNVDCLILDEPTNDLDIPTINILESALLDFPGAVIFVSHDRYYVDKIAKKLLIFKGQGDVEESWQSYTEYLELDKELHELDALANEIAKDPITPAQRTKSQPKQLSYKEKLEYEKLPHEIAVLEESVAQINACLGDPECYAQKGIIALSQELEHTKTLLDTKVERYLELEMKLEELMSQV